jgi:hypothetical protein
MSEEYREKLRTLGFSTRRGTSERHVIRDERDGTVAGIQTDHWDDRVDAKVRLKPIRVKARRVGRP